MDLLVPVPAYGIVVCQACRYAIPPSELSTHLNTHHRTPKGPFSSLGAVREVVEQAQQWALLDPRHETVRRPLPTDEPVAQLPVYAGLQCLRCPFVSRTLSTFRKHFGRTHDNGGYHNRGRRSVHAPAEKGHQPVSCQRYFTHGPQSDYFRVTPAAAPKPSSALPLPHAGHILPAALDRSQQEEQKIQAYVEAQLRQDHIEQASTQTTVHDDASKTEVSPWLEMTRWPRYLQGHPFRDLARLGARADCTTEPLLHCFSESLDRLVETAYISISQEKINVFDQSRINSFIQRQRVSDRPLVIQLQKATYQKYKAVWQRLLCFVYRTVQPENLIQLSHRLTPLQRSQLDRLIVSSRDLLALDTTTPVPHPAVSPSRLRADRQKELQDQVDRACLSLCIALLDHTLKGDLFESAIVGFLAVLGVDFNKELLMEAYSYTPFLSAFVKVGQMLVVQSAVLAVEDGLYDNPGDRLDEMRERFLMHGSRSPFSWVLRLRAYGKKIRNSTTSLGYIHWSDDNETLYYKDLELRMADFREFVWAEIKLLQSQFEDLLLLHPDEDRTTVVPFFHARDLRDNAANGSNQWNFLRDPRNQKILPPGERWILDRIITQSRLHADFLSVDHRDQPVWNHATVQGYISRVKDFLRRLLLLCHLTSGQPARGTEILSLRHSNTAQGQHRSIFIEDGLVSTVTAYHKGYSTTGSTKIIHRYLPNEVGELMIYYLWLILPFWQYIERRTTSTRTTNSPFLWPKDNKTWDSIELSKMLTQEAKTHLRTSLGITSYRHAAIAISRVHLPNGGFKKDFDGNEQHADHQAGHASWTAGIVYARGLEEAPGHVRTRMREYRLLSQEWHDFLGFRRYPPAAPKRPLSEIKNESDGRKTRRKG